MDRTPDRGTISTRREKIATLARYEPRQSLKVLAPIYEHDFLDGSYGFRPGRNAHQALARVWQGLMKQAGGWVIDLDIQGFFDRVDHDSLRRFIGTRVRDGVIRRVVGKWLNAGVMAHGAVHQPDRGTPQGGVISPLLANIYLHEVLDQWFEYTVKPRLSGAAFMVRYADDAVLAFAHEQDARRVLAVLAKRLAKYGLSLHPDKTRLVDYRRPSRPSKRGHPGQSFDLLGFTHYWGASRQGQPVIKRKTAKDRMSAALARITQWCKTHRHWPIAHQQRALSRKLTGHDAYYGITGNGQALRRFHRQVERRWRYWLSRRSRKATLNWHRFKRLLATYPLPQPRVVHSVYRQAANP